MPVATQFTLVMLFKCLVTLFYIYPILSGNQLQLKYCLFIEFLTHWYADFRQAIAQGIPGTCNFNVLIREDAKV